MRGTIGSTTVKLRPTARLAIECACDYTDDYSELRQRLLVFGLAITEHLAACASAVGLTPPQAHALRLLESALSMKDLAVAMHCDASNLTGIIDRLESRGLLERHVPSEDRRVKYLVVTTAGREVRDRFEAQFFGDMPGLALLDDRSQATMLAQLRTMTGAAAPSDG